MKTIKREAKVGERILINNVNQYESRYSNGAVFEVAYSSSRKVYTTEDYMVLHSEYEVIVEEEKRMTDDIEARYVQAVEQARDAIEELRLASLAKGYEDARRELTSTSLVTFAEEYAGKRLQGYQREFASRITPITPQRQRDAIVERAKEDVAKISTTWRPSCSSLDYGLCAFNPNVETVNFEVNSVKRTVVCYITYDWNGKSLTSFRGIAKCAPSDCFNAHIGKAIALRRALGLEVPGEFLNAPQPTDVRVGDVIKTHIGEPFEIVTIRDSASAVIKSVMTGERSYILSLELSKIIDDTREGVDA